MGNSTEPTEAGWYHRADDPEGLERWWTGAEWTEYTQQSSLPVAPTAVVEEAAVVPDATTGNPFPVETAVVDESPGGDDGSEPPMSDDAASSEDDTSSSRDSAAPEPDSPEPADTETQDIEVTEIGTTDAGTIDSESLDSGSADSETIDAEAIATGTTDAGTIDSETIDSGSVETETIDSGTVDSGSVDSGTIDTGTTDIEEPATEIVAIVEDQDGGITEAVPVGVTDDARNGDTGSAAYAAAAPNVENAFESQQPTVSPQSAAEAHAPTEAQPVPGAIPQTQPSPQPAPPSAQFQTQPGAQYQPQPGTQPAPPPGVQPQPGMYYQAGGQPQPGMPYQQQPGMQYQVPYGQAAPAGPPPAPGENPFAAGLAKSTGFVDRILASGDSEGSGWDRNMATLAWFPILSLYSLISYVISGSKLSEFARAHIAGAINFVLTVVLMGATFWFISLGSFTSLALGILLLLVATAIFAFSVYYLISTKHADKVGAWIWMGCWVFVAFFLAVFPVVGIVLSNIFSLGLLAIVVTNIVRARIGLALSYLGLPVIPFLSQR